MTDLGTRLPALGGPVPGPASRELARRLQRVESRNVTYLGDRFPVFWTEARGANVVDADGNVFLDLTSAFGVAFAGHAHPRVVAAVRTQAGHLVHGMGDVHPPALKVALLERLASLTPWSETRGILAGSGSEAVEAALKTAALASGRPGILAFEGSYHGLTLGSLATTHRPFFRRPFAPRLYPGVAFAPFPGPDESEAALARLESLLDSGAPDGSAIGTVILEPIQGRAGVRIPPPGFIEAAVDRARAAGCVVVADEIFTGAGRTGALFASPAGDRAPDVLCMGKALGGGLPIGVCLARADVMAAWPASQGEALHTSTFLGHPLAAAAALAFLDVLEAEDLAGRAARLGSDLLTWLRDGLSGLAGVADVRGAGLMLAVELRDARNRPLRGGGVQVVEAALGRGVLLLAAGDQGHVVQITPPAVLTVEQARFGARVVVDSVVEVLTGP